MWRWLLRKCILYMGLVCPGFLLQMHISLHTRNRPVTRMKQKKRPGRPPTAVWKQMVNNTTQRQQGRKSCSHDHQL